MPNEPTTAPFGTVLFTPEFKRNLRQLTKKYRRIKSEVQPLLDELAQGQTPSDQIPGVQYEVFKVRVRNSDSGKGTSGGYRVIYQRTTAGAITLITIYSKTEQEDIAANEIGQFIHDHETQQRLVDDATSTEQQTEMDAKQLP